MEGFSEQRRVEELMKMMLRLLVKFGELSPVMIVLHLQAWRPPLIGSSLTLTALSDGHGGQV